MLKIITAVLTVLTLLLMLVTGFTLWGTIRSFLEVFPSISGFPLFVLCTVPTNRGISHLSKEAKKKGSPEVGIFYRNPGKPVFGSGA